MKEKKIGVVGFYILLNEKSSCACFKVIRHICFYLLAGSEQESDTKYGENSLVHF